MSAAATRHRCGTRGRTRTPWVIRSSSRSSPGRTGAGATWTRRWSDLNGTAHTAAAVFVMDEHRGGRTDHGSRVDRDQVLHLGDTGRRPGDTLGLTALRPRPYAPGQDHLAALGGDADPFRVCLGRAYQGVLDLLLELIGRRAGTRPHGDEVADPLNAGEVPDHPLRLPPLVVPVHLAAQGDPAAGHRDLHHVVWYERVHLERPRDGLGEVDVGLLVAGRQAYLDVVDDGLDPADTKRRAFGRPLLAERVHPAGERRHPALYGHADLVRRDLGVPLQLEQHLTLDVLISLGGYCARHAGPPRPLVRQPCRPARAVVGRGPVSTLGPARMTPPPPRQGRSEPAPQEKPASASRTRSAVRATARGPAS